ncbi:MAG: CRTAC1 family protein [Acidobacteriota bacterium]
MNWLFTAALLLWEAQPIQFVDVTSESGIDFRHQNFATAAKHLPETMGSGAAFLDFDRDGWLDVYLVNGAPLSGKRDDAPPNRLYRNLGNGRFSDVTAKSGLADRSYGMGVAVGDYDNDGWPDLYLTNYGPNRLFRNRGDGSFQDVTEKAGLADTRWSASAGFFDYNKDGLLDLYVTNYLDYPLENPIECSDYEMKERSYCHPHHFSGVPDSLFRNNGDGTFSDVSQAAGIARPDGKGLGVVLADLDADGWPDIYVANDSVGNFLFRNKGDGSFEDLSLPSGTGYNGDGKPEAGMGVDAGDVDGDGRADLFVTNLDFESNTLYRNQGNLRFEDQTNRRGLGQPSFLRVGFGTCLFDFDNDGDLDVFIANGHILDNVASSRPFLSYPQANQLYENRQGSFEEVSRRSGAGLASKTVSRGLAVGDYDNDGDLDLLVSNCNQPAQLLKNEGGNRRNWLSLNFRGRQSNRDGIGVRVRVRIGKIWRAYEKMGGTSYLSARSPRLHIGLGNASQADEIEILWPGGRRQKLENVSANRRLTVDEPE